MKGDTKMAGNGKVQVQMIGFATLKLTSPNGKVLLVDPWLSGNDFFPDGNPAVPEKYREDVGAFGNVDIVLQTHAHFDHLNLNDLVAIAERFDPIILTPVETAVYIREHTDLQNFCNGGFGMNRGTLPPIDGIAVSGVHCEHTSSEIELLDNGRLKGRDIGDPIGFVVEFENGFKVYISSDTGLCSDLKLVIGDYYKPDLAILNICGGGFTVGGDSAGYAVKMIDPKYVIPAHYGVFEVMDQTPENFLEALKIHAPDVEAIVLEPDETAEF
jgi:L-ascorbate metabolism protein UlaG (beta-lactamase superfamily)